MRAVVITSIFSATPAVRAFACLSDWRTIVVGDRKTPADWSCEGVEFISLQAQEKLAYVLAKRLPYDHYCRKMLGYLRAMERGATLIVDTDDDNAPLANWAVPPFEGTYRTVPPGRGFVNVYQAYTDAPIWPRGFPLAALRQRFDFVEMSSSPCRVGIWQGLANGDPDVDAIYRLVHGAECTFERRPPLVLGEGTLCPINSQNTAFQTAAFPLLYLPTTVTFRFTDILRGLVAQPILWRAGLSVGFTEATVHQERNPHDYVKDFEQEVPMYLQTSRVVDVVREAVVGSTSVEDGLVRAYAALYRAEVVAEEELLRLRDWLDDVQRLTGG